VWESKGARAVSAIKMTLTGNTMLNRSKPLAVWWFTAVGLAMAFGWATASASCPKVGFVVVEPHATLQTRPIKAGKNRTIFVRREPLTTTSDILDIKLADKSDPADDEGTLGIKFIPEADQRLHDATTNHSGMRIAFLFNDEILINVVWQGPYVVDLGGSQVDIRHGRHKAEELMKAIQGCTAIPANEQAH
jgi:hypothetical protein